MRMCVKRLDGEGGEAFEDREGEVHTYETRHRSRYISMICMSPPFGGAERTSRINSSYVTPACYPACSVYFLLQ